MRSGFRGGPPADVPAGEHPRSVVPRHGIDPAQEINDFAVQPDPWPTLVFSGEDEPTLANAVFLVESSARRHRATEARSWPTEGGTENLRAAARLLYDAKHSLNERLVIEWAECVADCQFMRLTTTQTVAVRVSGPQIEAVRRVFEEILLALPVQAPEDDGAIRVRFWTGGRHGADVTSRRLVAPRWVDCSDNYPVVTRRALESVMQDVEATATAGRLLLWHGPPGTGKTFALRALAREQAAVVSVDYILEPEAFLGGGAGLLTEMLDVGEEASADGWRLLVLEDADELIAADAKQRAGQGLSRLLNLADGLFGQAFKVLVLITTNEPMTAFHPAIARPGRCGSLVTFERFGPEEATAWLSRTTRGARLPVAGSLTLAELYALKAGRPVQPSSRTLGFRSRDAAEMRGDRIVSASTEVAP